MQVKIKPSDHVNYMTSDEKCSRCRREIREDEVPLRLWSQKDSNYMWIYCEDCTDEILSDGLGFAL